MTISLNVRSFLPLILISKQSIINCLISAGTFALDLCHPVPLGGGGANDIVEVARRFTNGKTNITEAMMEEEENGCLAPLSA